jgi:hypothetical protein
VEHETVVTDEEETREENRESGLHDRPFKIMPRHRTKKEKVQAQEEEQPGQEAQVGQSKGEESQFVLFEELGVVQDVEHHTHETDEEETREENRESGEHDRPMKLMWRHPKKSQRAQEEAEGAQGGVADQQQQQAEDTQGGSVKEFALFDDSTMMMQAVEHHTHETDEEETYDENRESGMHDRPVKMTVSHPRKEKKAGMQAKEGQQQQQQQQGMSETGVAKEFALFDDSTMMMQAVEHHTVETDEDETREENRESGAHDRPIKMTGWHHKKGKQAPDSENQLERGEWQQTEEFALFDDVNPQTQQVHHETVATDEEETREENRESGMHDRPVKITVWHHDKSHVAQPEWRETMSEPTREFGMGASEEDAGGARSSLF